jgi:hypothetical protein
MSWYRPAVATGLVKDLISATPPQSMPPAFKRALQALAADYARVSQEDLQVDAEVARAEARKNPALTVQRVLGILRRSKLDLSSYDSRIGRSTGLKVEYGDLQRTFVKVTYSFAWDFGYTRNLSDASARQARTKLVEAILFTNARVALVTAGLLVSAHHDPDKNPIAAHLKVSS